MPELPEVQTIITDLKKAVIGRTIRDVACDAPKYLAPYKLADFTKKAAGRKILEIKRRAKFIIYRLSSDFYLVQHLKLTGQMLIRKKGDPPEPYVHFTLYLDGGLELRFNDLRKFGKVWLLSKEEFAHFSPIVKLGPEPLSKDFTFEVFQKVLRSKRGKIKPILMDQSVISGLGNIYSDEVLFEAQIHPETLVNRLGEEDLKKIYQAISKILKEALRKRGTSVAEYVDAFGRRGGYDLSLKVYRRTGKPCVRCGTPIQSLKFGQRSAHFCPQCQKKK